MTAYLQAWTKLPSYLPFPRFLLETGLTQTAKLLYAVLLDRAALSQENGWMDERGQIYIIYPVAKIAGAIGRSAMTVKNALGELEDAGLIERRRQNFRQSNRIYVKLPRGLAEEAEEVLDEVLEKVLEEGQKTAEGQKAVSEEGQKAVSGEDRNLSRGGKETCPREGKKSVQRRERKLSTNNLRGNNLRKNNQRGVRERPPALGRYQNVFLSGAEAGELREEFPGTWEAYVERLSAYMASTGKTYKNHAATIRRWAQEDGRKQGPRAMADYACGEGESL